MTEPSIFEHVKPTGYDHVPGIYRVVGVDEESVTLLRVTDGEGNRRATGEIVTTERPLSGFEAAVNPDAGVHPLRWLRDGLQGAVWEVRALTGL